MANIERCLVSRLNSPAESEVDWNKRLQRFLDGVYLQSKQSKFETPENTLSDYIESEENCSEFSGEQSESSGQSCSDSSGDNLEVNPQRRVFLKAKRRLSGKPTKVHYAMRNSCDEPEESSNSRVLEWLQKHQSYMQPEVSSTKECNQQQQSQSEQQPETKPVHPTHQLVWVNALVPGTTADQKATQFCSRLVPLLVPIESVSSFKASLGNNGSFVGSNSAGFVLSTSEPVAVI
ncbi:uncharacterized protein LOC129720838 isoform X1 [Wyeomyia smithii]|uniref:uncharacterized protein LOC129720838 isoform X1 n=1 Tax=Wyeomyia smithii TaxID=174621 RepID=UPI00246819A0|nr:uncharacterized protein LOC129720838 isoform X1 [Wyeomyia smithii]